MWNQNFSSTFPFFSNSDLDLVGLKCIRAHSISFSRSCKIHQHPRTDSVVTVRSFIKAIIGGCHWAEFSLGSSTTHNCTGILLLLQKTRRIFHRQNRSLGQFLHILYEILLGPGTKSALALQITSLMSFNCSSDKLNCVSGSGGSIKMSHCSNSFSLFGSLYVLLRNWSIPSCEQTSFPLHFCPSNSLVNFKGSAIKAARLWALSWWCLQYPSAGQRTLIVFPRIHISWAKPMHSLSPAFLNWEWDLNSCDCSCRLCHICTGYS